MDNITVVGSSLEIEDIILHILHGLPPSYQAFKIAICPINLDDLYSLLCSEETNLQNEQAKELPTSTDLALALFSNNGLNPFNSRNRGRFNARRGNYTNTRGSRPNAPSTSCQICGKPGHITPNCWYRYNSNY